MIDLTEAPQEIEYHHYHEHVSHAKKSGWLVTLLVIAVVFAFAAAGFAFLENRSKKPVEIRPANNSSTTVPSSSAAGSTP
ncbi:MAG: hypothetical protein ACM3KM_04045 [Acidobacteriaceae bacterium]